MLLPEFTPGEPGTDWNDWAAKHGKQAVRELVEAVPAAGQAMRDAARRQTRSAVPSDVAAEAARRAQLGYGRRASPSP